ncbi:ATP-binding protein [Roseateles sp.]|uniref:sensor histidine kinase n=1 Tax=Roseateles sp. TaxID=1971397 RepID=UPI0025F9A0A9|nr:ATP-binding protein [Roseateles sp.]MBV8036553.1 HAMP domain-containing protein [Roseateles sp.]
MLSFRRRLALVHLVSITAVLAITAWVTYWSLVNALRGQLDGALLALAEQEAGILAENPRLPVRVHEAGASRAPPSYARLDRLVQIIDARGGVLARSGNLGDAQLPTPPALLERLKAGETVFETLRHYGEEPTRLVSVPIRGHGSAWAVQVAGSLDDVDHAISSAGYVFAAMGFVLVVVVTLGGALLTRRAFGAISDVVQQARAIGDANLAARLQHPGTQDEIGRLVDTLNDMLMRIELSFEAQRRFTADASHELRSPLSRLRAELEITLRRPRESADYVNALRSCLDEVERLTLMVEELLALARLDAGQEAPHVGALDLAPVVESAVQRLRGMAQRQGVELHYRPAPDMRAQIAENSLGLVIANLLDNAIKFCGSAGHVGVSLSAQDGFVRIDVDDDGPGVAEEDMPHLFERFYRGASARGGAVSGVGLGLALCEAILKVYEGRIEVGRSTLGGSRFSVVLPRALR